MKNWIFRTESAKYVEFTMIDRRRKNSRNGELIVNKKGNLKVSSSEKGIENIQSRGGGEKSRR